MWLILKTGAKFSNALSQGPLYDRHMHSHAHSRKTSAHRGPGNQRVIPTHQSVVLGKKLQKSAKFSQPRAAADLAKQGLLHILIKVSLYSELFGPHYSPFSSSAEALDVLASNVNIL